MNAHKKSKSNGNPGPRSSNLQLWTSKPRGLEQRLRGHAPKKRFLCLIFLKLFFAVCPFHIRLYHPNPPKNLHCISPRLFARNLPTSSLLILPRYSPATAFVPSPKMAFVDC